MRKADWKRQIIEKCKNVGTYRSDFLPAIITLSAILEERDRVYKQYVAEGAQPVIDRTSDRGAVNKSKNPLLTTWQDLNKDALSYWRDLGLTPAGLKKIGDDPMKSQKTSALAEALRGIE